MPGDSGPVNSGAARRAAMYASDNVSSHAIVSGNFLNFGYWQEFTPGLISIDERTESEANLYRTVLRRLEIAPTEVALEVGCGMAAGAALALREFNPRAVHGLDLSPEQIERARRINAELLAHQPDRFVLRQGSALDIPYTGEQFDKCYSVEAAQHFENLAAFASETYRVLRPGGRLAVTTFFTPYPAAITELRRLIEAVDNGVDVVVPIGSFRDDLLEVGFADVCVHSIGDHVWRGFDAWVGQTEYRDSWVRNWLAAYQRGLVDYYLLTADKK